MRPNKENIIEVFHASNHSFSKPDIAKISQNRVNHINGLLGLFFSTTNDTWFHGFGKYIYSIKIPENFNCKIISVGDFHKLTSKEVSNDAERYFQNLREEFISNDIDYILIEESDGTYGMGVFINLDIELEKIKDAL